MDGRIGWPPVNGHRRPVGGAQRMALPSRDRIGVDLRGIGDAVRAAACARHSTVAAFAREALVEAIGRPSTFPERMAAEFGRAGIVKLTLRLREPEAEALIVNATGLGLSYGEYVARLVRQTPLPMPATERAADRAVLMASSDSLAALSVDLAAFMRLLRMGKSTEGREVPTPHRDRRPRYPSRSSVGTDRRCIEEGDRHADTE